MKPNNEATLERFRRQYFQLVEVKDLLWPSKDVLRPIESQTWLFRNLFDFNSITYMPPKRYGLRVLKHLLQLIQDSVQYPDEDVGGILCP
jgi:hypothetical protein